jgi:hypothetical protein
MGTMNRSVSSDDERSADSAEQTQELHEASSWGIK